MSLAADLLRAVDPVALAREIGMEPDGWLATRAAVLEALALHPEARAAVAQRLAALAGPVMVGATEPRLVGSSHASAGEEVGP